MTTPSHSPSARGLPPSGPTTRSRHRLREIEAWIASELALRPAASTTRQGRPHRGTSRLSRDLQTKFGGTLRSAQRHLRAYLQRQDALVAARLRIDPSDPGVQAGLAMMRARANAITGPISPKPPQRPSPAAPPPVNEDTLLRLIAAIQHPGILAKIAHLVAPHASPRAPTTAAPTDPIAEALTALEAFEMMGPPSLTLAHRLARQLADELRKASPPPTTKKEHPCRTTS